jgi:hypothetical protein
MAIVTPLTAALVIVGCVPRMLPRTRITCDADV